MLEYFTFTENKKPPAPEKKGGEAEKNLLLFCFFGEPGKQFQTFFRTGLNTAAAENTAELFKVPLFGLACDFDGVGRAFADTHSTEDTLLRFNDKFSPLTGERFTLDGRIIPGGRTFDQISENIFEYGK